MPVEMHSDQSLLDLLGRGAQGDVFELGCTRMGQCRCKYPFRCRCTLATFTNNLEAQPAAGEEIGRDGHVQRWTLVSVLSIVLHAARILMIPSVTVMSIYRATRLPPISQSMNFTCKLRTYLPL